MQIERPHGDVIVLRHERKAGRIASYLLMGDVHFDSLYCDRRMLKRHLDQARDMGAGVLVNGDLFDAMQGKEDRRGSKGAIRDEYKGDNYFDRIVDDAADFFAPYGGNLAMLADGNHETAVLKHHETDLLARLSRRLGVQHMGYSGYVEFAFGLPGGGHRKSFSMFYHHGSGGGGPVTKGMIGNSRRSMMADADIFWSQHIHEFTLAEYAKVSLVCAGKARSTRIRRETHVTGGGYKQEYDMAGGWHVERGMPPKTNGAWWLHFDQYNDELDYTFERTR